MEKEKTIKIASGGVAEECRNLGVGETIAFPVPKYNPNTVRNTPSGALLKERIDGKKWLTSLSFEDSCVYVTRVR